MRNLTEKDDARLVLVQEEPRGPSQVIEVPVTANGLSKINFPDIANLRNQDDQIIVIKALRLITPSVLTNGPVSGLANAPLTELQKISLVLYSEQWEKGQYIPVLTLNDMFTEGSGEPWKDRTTKLDNWRNLDWNKCFAQYSNSTVTAGTPYCLLFEVEYVKLRRLTDGSLQEIIGPA